MQHILVSILCTVCNIIEINFSYIYFSICKFKIYWDLAYKETMHHKQM